MEDVAWSWLERVALCAVLFWFVLAAEVLESTDVELDAPTTTGVVAEVVVVVVSVATVSDDRVL